MNQDDSGENAVVAQRIVLSQAAVIESMSFYVTTAAGKMRMGIYNDNNDNPGTLHASTAEFTPVVGWNNQNVQTPITLPAGTYWLAFLNDNDALHARSGWTGDGSNSGRYYDYTYGDLPATFSASAQSGDFQFSLFATFVVSVPQGTIYAGETDILYQNMDGTANKLIAQTTELSENAVVQSLSFYVTNAAGKLRLGIYQDGTDGPGALMAQTDEFTPVPGWNTVNVQQPILLSAGTYWLAFLPESDDLQFRYEWVQGLYTGREYDYEFGEMPLLASGQHMGVEYRYSFYATLIAEGNQVNFPTTGVLDDFNRSNSGTLGANWISVFSDLSISSNRAAGSSSSDNDDYYNAASYGPDVEAYTTITTLPGNNNYVQLWARLDVTNTNLYLLEYEQLSGTDAVRFYRVDGGSSIVQIGSTINQNFSAGDLLGLRIVGSALTAWYKPTGGSWTLLGSVMDGTYDNAGYIGLGIYGTTGRVDDFGGGNVTGMSLAPQNDSSIKLVSYNPAPAFVPLQQGQETDTPTPTASYTPSPTETATPTPVEPTATERSVTPTLTFTLTPTMTPTPIVTSTPLLQGPITIDYVYDPLYRLAEANYSTGDYYHYGYDAVGNRLTQDTLLGGLPSTTSYVYDDANRVQSVDGVTYTFDDNGNLLNDGVNTYTYDSANRLTAMTSGQVAMSYVYNGLGDRLQETMNGQTTVVTMDYNMGLTQALSDGTNTYIYGNGRIAQMNGTATDYFLPDALGSVRQLTDTSGAITYASAYDPYGVVAATSGASGTPYGYTGEYTSNDLVYLRARHYAPAMGRFLTRDTWGGDANIPMSFNRWNYGYGNPVQYTDPTGNCSWTENNRINTAKKSISPQPNDWMTTYIAAGIAIQCWGTAADKLKDPGYYNGAGIAQISQAQTEIAYGMPVDDPGQQTIFGIWLRKPSRRGYGLRCYIPLLSNDPCVCKTPIEIESTPDFYRNYQLEEPHELTDSSWSVEYMRRRIQMVVNECKDRFCQDRDKFIVAALAQNGSGFTVGNIGDLKAHLTNNQIQWKEWYSGLSARSKSEYRDQWRLFYKFTRRLNNDGYYLPPNILNDDMILWLKDQ